MKRAIIVVFLLAAMASSGLPVEAQSKAENNKYELQSWKNLTCRAKGRFQDPGYCASPVINKIGADGKSAIPILISQITDSRLIEEPVYDYWPQIRTGDLAYFILEDLFLDDTWTHRTMPELFTDRRCNEASWVCWERFSKKHSLPQIQARWMAFWNANRERIYWDSKSRCFRLSDKVGGKRSQMVPKSASPLICVIFTEAA